jgi:hypothetical protein
MRSSHHPVAAALWGLAASAMPIAASASERPAQELLCTTTSPDTRHAKFLVVEAFLNGFSVQPDRKKFCVGDVCWPVTRKGDVLEYSCSRAANADRYCAPYPLSGRGALVSTAGPFLSNVRLSINLTTGQFEGEASGSVGDIGPRDYSSKIAGSCVPGHAQEPG